MAGNDRKFLFCKHLHRYLGGVPEAILGGMPGDAWMGEGLRFACTMCGRCCRTHGDHAWVYLSERDVSRIAGHLGLDEDTFRARHCRTLDGWTVLAADEPACPFLDPDRRCRIYPVRPKQCSTWPFWAENLDPTTWEETVRPICPGIGTGPLYPPARVRRIARENEEWYGA